METLKEFAVTGSVSNLGTRRAADYTVALLENGETVASVPGKPLESGESADVSFCHVISPLNSGDPGITPTKTYQWKMHKYLLRIL